MQLTKTSITSKSSIRATGWTPSRVEKDVICHDCKKPGHLPRACSIQPNKLLLRPKKSSSSSPFKSRSINQVEEEECDEEQLLQLFSVRPQEHTKEPPITSELKVDGCLVSMGVDTGAATYYTVQAHTEIILHSTSSHRNYTTQYKHTQKSYYTVQAHTETILHSTSSHRNYTTQYKLTQKLHYTVQAHTETILHNASTHRNHTTQYKLTQKLYYTVQAHTETILHSTSTHRNYTTQYKLTQKLYYTVQAHTETILQSTSSHRNYTTQYKHTQKLYYTVEAHTETTHHNMGHTGIDTQMHTTRHAHTYNHTPSSYGKVRSLR